VTRTAHIVLMSTMAFALSACDGIYFRRIDISGADTAAVDVRSPDAQRVISTLRDYAAQAKVNCPAADKLPFECSRQPIRILALLSEHGVTVCYIAMGTAFESTKFERRMDHLQSMLAERFGALSVQSSRNSCPLPPKS
jgi:hypothetical protein